MAVNVCFILQHCFPARPPPTDKGYSPVQSHHKHLKISLKDILFELAISYMVINLIRGIVSSSCYVGKGNVNRTEDKIDKQLEIGNTEWQKEATKYVKDGITPESCYKLKKFVNDEILNRIHLDKTLFHIPKSH
jgi:hypothetical protein